MDNIEVKQEKNCEAQSKKKVFIKELIMLSFAVVIFPIASVLTCISTGLPVYEITLSRIAWRFNMIWLIYLWGIIGGVPLVFTVYQACMAGKYSKRNAWIFAGALIFALAVMCVGIAIPSNKTELMGRFHFAFSIIGFVLLFVVLWGLTFSMCRKNRVAFIVSLSLDVFLLVTGVFMLCKANSLTGAASALAEVYCFMMYDLIAVIDYYMLKYVPAGR